MGVIVDAKEINVSKSIDLINDKNSKIGELRSGAYSPHFKKVIGIAMMDKPFWEVSQKFKISTNLEYRMNSRHFMFSFWDQGYELNGASVISDTKIETNAGRLLQYGELKGLYFNTNLSLLNPIILKIDLKQKNYA